MLYKEKSKLPFIAEFMKTKTSPIFSDLLKLIFNIVLFNTVFVENLEIFRLEKKKGRPLHSGHNLAPLF